MTRYARWPQASAVRIELARRARETGRFQDAELLLLEVRRGGGPQAVQAGVELAELWVQMGLYQEAASLLARLERETPHVEIDRSATVRQYVERAELEPLLIPQGSVAVDGVSLTVAGLDGPAFEVMLIPHTLAATTLGRLRPGQAVNIETDVIGKYVLRSTVLKGGS